MLEIANRWFLILSPRSPPDGASVLQQAAVRHPGRVYERRQRGRRGLHVPTLPGGKHGFSLGVLVVLMFRTWRCVV